MKTISMTAALMLAAPLLVVSAAHAGAREVHMFDSVPSVEELQANLAPEAPHHSRSIEIAAPAAAPAAAAASRPASYVASGATAGVTAAQTTAKAEPATAEPAAPAKAEAAARRHGPAAPTTVGFHIQFAFNSTAILAPSRPFLDQLGKVMQARPDLAVAVEGHTDAVGGDAYNMELSKRRAASVKAYLVETWKVAPDRLDVEGRGKSEPLVADPYAPENRRVQFRPLTRPAS